MFARLLLESLRRDRRRKLLALGAIALGTGALAALGAALLHSGDRLAAELATYGANLELRPAAPGATLDVAALGATRRIFWRNNVLAVAPVLAVRVRFAPAAGSAAGPVGPLVGTWFAHHLESGFRTGLPRTRPALELVGPGGRWPRDEAREAAVGRRLAARLGVGVGDSVVAELGAQRQRLQVVGVVGGGGEEEEQAFAPLALVGRLAGSPGRFTRAEIFALTVPERDFRRRDPRRMSAAEYDAWYCTAYASAIAHQLEEAIAGARASVVRATAAPGGELLGRLRGVLALLMGLLAAGAMVGTTAAMAATVVERRLEVGLFGALGCERGRVALFFLSEAALLGAAGGLAGGAVGLAAGRLLGRLLLGAAVPWAPVLLPLAIALGIAIAVLGSLPPVLRAVWRDPAALLKRATA